MTSAKMADMLISVALCSSSLNVALASVRKITLYPILERVAPRAIAAVIGQRPGDDERVDAASLQLLVHVAGAWDQGGEARLVDDEVVVADIELRR